MWIISSKLIKYEEQPIDHSDKCDISDWSKSQQSSTIVLIAIRQITNQTFIRAFFCSFVILIFKDTNDLLEGISKLDDQIMFSRFQRSVASWRKDPNLLNHLS